MKLMIDIPDNELDNPLKNIHLLIDNGIVTEVCITKYDKDKPYYMDLNYTSLEECGDCVSRQAVLNLAKFDGRENLGSIIHAFDVEQLPPVKPEQKWIPVSERLPEKDGEYLVTVKPTFKNMRNYIKHCDFALNLYLVDEYDFVDKKGVAGFYKYDSEYGYYEMTEVIAWCELLEPYKAESEK